MVKRVYYRIRFGKVTTKVMDRVEGHVAEVAYYDRRGNLIGWWAYGYFDPNLPYRG